MKGGVVMGLSEALKEEVTFDQGKVTSTNWSRYKILTMEEMPEIKVVQISRDDKGFGGGRRGCECRWSAGGGCGVLRCNRRATLAGSPLTPAYVTTLLKGLALTDQRFTPVSDLSNRYFRC